jgi:hypothetical protein
LGDPASQGAGSILTDPAVRGNVVDTGKVALPGEDDGAGQVVDVQKLHGSPAVVGPRRTGAGQGPVESRAGRADGHDWSQYRDGDIAVLLRPVSNQPFCLCFLGRENKARVGSDRCFLRQWHRIVWPGAIDRGTGQVDQRPRS